MKNWKLSPGQTPLGRRWVAGRFGGAGRVLRVQGAPEALLFPWRSGCSVGLGLLGISGARVWSSTHSGPVCPQEEVGRWVAQQGEGQLQAPRVSSPLPTARPGPQVRRRDPGASSMAQQAPGCEKAHCCGTGLACQVAAWYPDALDLLAQRQTTP